MSARIVWGYAEDKDAETFDGHCDTREEAIAEGRAEYGPGVAFVVARGECPDPALFAPCVGDIVETMETRADDHGKPDLVDWPVLTDAAKEELEALLDAWARKHAPCDWWIAADIEQVGAEVGS